VLSIVIGQTIVSFWHKEGKEAKIIISKKATTWNPNQYQSVNEHRVSDNCNPKPKPKIEVSSKEIKYAKKME
jgi:hypothetical protein